MLFSLLSCDNAIVNNEDALFNRVYPWKCTMFDEDDNPINCAPVDPRILLPDPDELNNK